MRFGVDFNQQIMPAKHTAILSLGSNLGDRAGWLSRASEAVEQLPGTRITARSSLYETEPVDVPAEHGDLFFLNAVILIETDLDPNRLSTAIHEIEDVLHRTREIANNPRTIDIDIIVYDELISDDPQLTLPHPRACLRRFVLEPLAEIAPNFVLPGQNVSVGELLATLPDEPAVLQHTGVQQ